MTVPRLLVEPDGLAARIPYDSDRSRHVRGKVLGLTDRTARVSTFDGIKRTLSFDYAVNATGSAYLDPLIVSEGS